MILNLFKVKSALILLLFIICGASSSFADKENPSKKDFNNADYYYNLGLAHQTYGKNQEAIEAFRQAIRIKPDHASAQSNLSVSYGKVYKLKQAIYAYKQTIKFNPDYVNAHFNLGVSYLALQDKDSALDQYKILKDLDKEKADELLNLIYP